MKKMKILICLLSVIVLFSACGKKEQCGVCGGLKDCTTNTVWGEKVHLCKNCKKALRETHGDIIFEKAYTDIFTENLEDTSPNNNPKKSDDITSAEKIALNIDSEALETFKKLIKEKAELLLNDEVEVSFNTQEQIVMIFYKGKQAMETVENVFSEIKTYMKDIGLNNYKLGIGGNDGQPFLMDEDNFVYNPVFVAPKNVSYNCVGGYSMSDIPLFEIVSTKETNEGDGTLVIETLKREMPNANFNFYLVDENEVFLGSGWNKNYTSYVYTPGENLGSTPGYAMPFIYYFSKYFSEIECEYYEYNTRGYDDFGRIVCEYIIEPMGPDYYDASKEAAQKVLEVMDRTLRDKVKVVIRVYANTADEIRLEASDPIEEENLN